MGKLLDKFDHSLTGKVLGTATRTGITFGAIVTLPGLMIGYSAKHKMEKELDALGANLGQALMESMKMSKFDQTTMNDYQHTSGVGRPLPFAKTNQKDEVSPYL